MNIIERIKNIHQYRKLLEWDQMTAIDDFTRNLLANGFSVSFETDGETIIVMSR